LLRELDDLYIPANERQLRNVQRKGDELEKQVRTWAQCVIGVLPRGLPLNDDERYLFSLFLAQQRRLNLQMDAYQPDNSFLGTAKQIFPFAVGRPDPEAFAAVHRIVATRLDSDIDRACRFFCEDNRVDPEGERSIDWRVGIRFMAQSVYSRLANAELKKLAASPRRFELAAIARDLSSDITEKRQVMLSTAPARAG
jgi:hypothetical protein